MKLTDQYALITGASRGIGRVIAQKFAAAGATVAVHYHQNKAAADETLASLAGEGHFGCQANIADPEAVEVMVNRVISQFGRLDVLVNNAGIFEAHPIDKVDYYTWLNKWDKVVQTNLIGPANVTYWAVQQMLKQGNGKIINVGSRGAYRGEPDTPAYGAAKAGLHAMSQSLAKQLGGKNIFVTAIAPCFVQTEMARDKLTGPEGAAIRNQSPLGRVATPEDVAHTALFLAAPGSEYLTGAVIDVNGASYLR